ncbi:hypothetical protein EDD17DRAFT_1517267 [Pisolithus thermaeus]|nr:hypothetical protein EDD17DRAFT_1517267 [Pisolithus thermaeus]
MPHACKECGLEFENRNLHDTLEKCPREKGFGTADALQKHMKKLQTTWLGPDEKASTGRQSSVPVTASQMEITTDAPPPQVRVQDDLMESKPNFHTTLHLAGLCQTGLEKSLMSISPTQINPTLPIVFLHIGLNSFTGNLERLLLAEVDIKMSHGLCHLKRAIHGGEEAK